ncbi:MAG: hypothetical protein IKC37_02430, partial [Clostridia bacterium]|nr:hypothetical protein [Clostridia bacterium]
KSVRNTNILTFDADYHFCYDFYLNYLYREPVLATPKQIYHNFVSVNLFRALTLCGYELADSEATIAVSNSIKLRYEEVAFANDLFTIRVCPTEDGDLMLKVKANPDFNESVFMVRIVNKARVREEHLFTSVNRYARELNANKDESVTREFLVSDYAPTKEPNAFYVEPAMADVLKKLQDLIRNCTMLAEGSFYIHSRICPVCGSNLVAPDGNDYLCAHCESIYHIFGYGAKMYLWLKQLPDVKTTDEIDEIFEEKQPVVQRMRLRVERSEKTEETPADEADETAQEPVEETAEEKEANVDELPTYYAEEPVDEKDYPVVEEEPVEETPVEEEPIDEPVEETIEEPVQDEVVLPVEEPIEEEAEERKVTPVVTGPRRTRIRLHVQNKEVAPARVEEAQELSVEEPDDSPAHVDVVN